MFISISMLENLCPISGGSLNESQIRDVFSRRRVCMHEEEREENNTRWDTTVWTRGTMLCFGLYICNDLG
jgi:hypothetical protein